MNLEDLEEKCLTYLQQTANPMVPLDTLLGYLKRDAEFADLDPNDALDFLRKHEQFHVIDGPAETDPETADELNGTGVSSGSRIILHNRIPPPAELTSLIVRQFDTMTDALQKALDEALREGNPNAAGKVSEMLDRMEALREAFKKVL